jgi:RNA polymerase sigma factor (TIGR02999 family)
MAVTEFTRMVQAMRAGDVKTAEELFPLVYAELHRLAAQKMAQEGPGHTLQATALVHEAWLRLGGAEQPRWQNRAHFFAAAAEAMRRILVDHARRKQRLKRGGDCQRVDIEETELPGPVPDEQLLEVDEALDELIKVNPRAAEVVKRKYFIELSHEEIAQQLGVSVATVERDWAYGKAWLFRQIEQARKK